MASQIERELGLAWIDFAVSSKRRDRLQRPRMIVSQTFEQCPNSVRLPDVPRFPGIERAWFCADCHYEP